MDSTALLRASLDDKYTLGHGPRLPHRHAGAGPPADAAARARPARRPQHRGLRLRLPRLAARRPRPGAVAREEAPREPPHQVPARRQRGPRRHRDLGHAAGQPLPGREVRRRLRHVVRQGPGRRPLRRRLQARQRRRHLAARRRAGARRRRPRREVLDARRTRASTCSRPAASRCSTRRTCRTTSTSACTASR